MKQTLLPLEKPFPSRTPLRRVGIWFACSTLLRWIACVSVARLRADDPDVPGALGNDEERTVVG